MKKGKFLALALVVAIMMMGAGYAYWTEDLRVENTITTGELDFEFQYEHIASQDEYMGDSEASVKTTSLQGETLEVVLEEMYPGAEATVKFDVANTGTMAAMLKNFNFDIVDKGYVGEVILKKVVVDDTTFNSNVPIDEIPNVNNIDFDLPKDGRCVVEMTFGIDEGANNSLENETIKFNINADVLQHNHEDSDSLN